MLILEKTIKDRFKIEIYNDQPTFDFIQVNQVHGNNVIISDLKLNSELIDADGIISPPLDSLERLEGLPLAIKTADCLPIFFIGESSCAVVHAGWRGLAQSIISDQKIQEIRPHSIFIGPCIGPEDYEVGEDFAKNFPKSNSLKKIKGRICFDLIEEAAKQIFDCYNIAPDLSLAENTFRHPHLNSWRENKTEKRNYNILKIIS